LARAVDFHCHLDLYPDFAKIVAECEAAQVFALTVTTTPRAWPRNHLVTSKTKYVRAALGLHPQLVADHQHEIALWDEYFPEARYIGEVGLDAGPRYFRSIPPQKAVFQHVLQACARAGGKILTVHSVRAVTPVLDMIEEYLPRGRARVVLHWFTGTRKEAQRAAELGCWFSINADMLRGDRHANMIAALPDDRLLTETDGPFTKVGDRPTHPRDATIVLQHLSVQRRIAVETLSKIVLDNLRSVTEPFE
jgi:TatD DNase family protein